MKSDLLNRILVGLMLVAALWLAFLCYHAIGTLNYTQELAAQAQQMQARLATAERNRNIVRSMAADAVEYGKRNPSIEALLQRFDLKPKPGAPAAPAPAGR